MQHIQDDAAMRMRSYAAIETAGLALPSGTNALARATTSNIQTNVVNLLCQGQVLEWLGELEVVSRKDGPTIASSIIGVVEQILATLEPSFGPGSSNAWVIP